MTIGSEHNHRIIWGSITGSVSFSPHISQLQTYHLMSHSLPVSHILNFISGIEFYL